MKGIRDSLLSEMLKLSEKNINCQNCPGTCCTFVANSMQITKEEAQDIWDYLQHQDYDWNELEERLKRCIEEFRLDQDIGTKAGQRLRRNYTCPFFQHKSLGCPLPHSVRPFGCLAFNPTIAGEINGSNCRSNRELLKGLPMASANEKESIPQALLKVLSKNRGSA